MVAVNHVMDIIVNHCQPDNQNVDFSGSDQIQTPQYPDVNPSSPEISNEEIFQARGELMKSIQTFLERFNCIPFEEKPQILFQTWETFFAIQCSQPEDSNELFQKLLKDLKELAEYDQFTSTDHPIFLNDNEDHHVQNRESPENSSKENVVSKTNQEPPQSSDIHQLIEECSVEVPEEQKQNMEKTMLDLVKICHHKQFLCMHDNVDDLIKSALDSKLLSINFINFQRLNKKEQEVKIVEEQPAEGRNRIEKSLQNFRVIHKNSIFLNASLISSIHEVAPILSTKKPENSLSMGYEHLSIIPETESDEVTKSNAKNLLPIPSECEMVSIEEENGVEEENVVQREEEEVDLEDISQVQNVVLREKLFSITHLISNIESLNDNSTPDCAFNSFESDNSLLDNYSPEFETFAIIRKRREVERWINLVNNDNSDSSNDPLLEEADLFLDDNSIPPGIENFADDPEGDIRFLEELLINDSILSHESFDSSFKDSPLILRPPPEPPDVETDVGEEITVMMNDKDKFDDDYQIFMFDKVFSLLSAESEDTIFDPGISD
nr:hypothetical protein [Tanacetum cinerariifolium]